MKPYRKSNIPFAKELRKEMTKYEKHLWYDFLRDYPVRFQRQKAIGRYIADFYCARAKLIVELDGSGHYEEVQEQYDKERTEYLERMGLHVLRFTNLDISQRFRGVCESIHNTVEEYRGIPTDFENDTPVKGKEGR